MDNVTITYALEHLHPQGGWSAGETYDSIIMPTGVEKPTEAEIVSAAATQKERLDKLAELSDLDKFVGRDAEAFYLANPDADPFLHEKVLRKQELRQAL